MQRAASEGGPFYWESYEKRLISTKYGQKRVRRSFFLAPSVRPLTSKPPMTTEGKLKRSRNPLDFDFTEPEALTRYVTETGKILPRKLTGLTARQQRHIAKAVKRARNMITMK
jgi:small subunit ribosomal protein S18